jgi:methylated-DNA-[protein]-cysteine S-methyltransferase
MDDVHMNVDWCDLATPFGPLQLAATDVGVVGVWFGSADDALAALARDLVDVTFTEDGPRVATTRTQVEEYVRGERQSFDLTLDWRRSKGFRLRVLQELATVPFGVTVSYGELARRSGSPSATRAVGSAMATNPLPVIVPCHRVVRRGGAIGGFGGARNAIDTKQWLLTHEGVLTPFAAAR